MMCERNYLLKASVAVSILISIQVATATAQVDNGWHANTITVEKLSKERPGSNYY
jgi:hypothetical protein